MGMVTITDEAGLASSPCVRRCAEEVHDAADLDNDTAVEDQSTNRPVGAVPERG